VTHELDSARLGQRHLRRSMDRQPRRQSFTQAGEADVLHDDSVTASRRNGGEDLGGLFELVGENQRVERDVTADVSLVEKPHNLRQFFRTEVGRAVPRVEAGHAEVDRVRAVRSRARTMSQSPAGANNSAPYSFKSTALERSSVGSRATDSTATVGRTSIYQLSEFREGVMARYRPSKGGRDVIITARVDMIDSGDSGWRTTTPSNMDDLMKHVK